MRKANRIIHRLVTGILIGLPPAAILRMILKYGQNIPWMDQWGVPGRIIVSHLRGTLSLSDFFHPHNESIKAVTGLVWFLLALNGWNTRLEMVVTWLLTLGLAAVLWFLLRRTFDNDALLRTSIFALMVLFLFHPYGTEHWLTGLSMENALVILLLSAGLLVNSSSAPTWTKYLLTACFSLAATFSYANGMLLWVLICPALPFPGATSPKPRSRIPILLYLAAALTGLFIFFTTLAASPYSTSQTRLELTAPLETIGFVLRWLGAPFHLPGMNWSGPVMAVVFLLLLAAPVALFARRRITRQDTSAYRPWLLLAVYVLVTGTIVALGRQGISPKTALAPRYFQHEVLLPLAVLPLAALVIRRVTAIRGGRRGLGRTIYATLAGLTVILCTISVIHQWSEADETARRASNKQARGAVALSFINVVPDNTELAFLHPRSRTLKIHGRPLIHHGIIDLTLHQPLPVGKNRPPEVRIDGLRLDLREDGSILVTGSCPATHAGGEISHILLSSLHGDRYEKGFAVITPALSQHREQRERSSAEETHFRTHVSAASLEPGRHRIKAWVYDRSRAEYRPLAGEWLMDKGDGGLVFPPPAPVSLDQGTD